MGTVRTRMSANGRIVIPATFRQQLKLKPGDELDMRVEANELHISTLEQSVERARARLKPYLRKAGATSEDFIAQRRKEAQRELSD